MPKAKNSNIPLGSGLILQITTESEDTITEAPAVTLWVTTSEGAASYALTFHPEEAQRVGAALAAAAIALPQRCSFVFRDKRVAQRAGQPVDHKRRCMNPSVGRKLDGRYFCETCRERYRNFGDAA